MQIVGDSARFLAGHKAASEAASRLAAQAALGRQFSVQFAGAQKFMEQYTKMGQAIAQQIAPIAKMTQAFNQQVAPIATGKIFAENFGAKYIKQFEGLGLQHTMKFAAGLTAASESARRFGELLRAEERAKRRAIARYRRAARLLNELPDDATFRESCNALEILAFGDARLLRRLMNRLATRAAQGHSGAAALLAWLYAIVDLLAANAFVRQVAAIVTVVSRRISHHLGRLEWRLRARDQHTDPVAHRHCANAPNGASVVEAAAA